jgi:glycosyltransferase involved in cell wall biosynthesis
MARPKIAFLVNQMQPYRLGVYKRLAAALDLIILHGGMESDRSTWKEESVDGARVRRVWGWQLSLNKRDRGRAIDHWFLHLEPGYITELMHERPDAVITVEMGFRTLVGLAYGTCFRKPVWVCWEGTPHTERQMGVFRKLLRGIIARWAERWISYGQTSTEYLLTLGIPQERILQVQNCVDETWFVATAEPALDVRPRPVLLHVGRMVAGKGIAEFLRAAARLQQEGLTFSTLLVGEGRDSLKLQQLAAELRLGNIHFYPAQPPKAMPGFYRSADALIFPTIRDVWGLVANEAVLSGLPVLCSRHAGCAPELFDPECIFDPTNEEQFVSALRRTVMGQLPRADPSRLWSILDVADNIANVVLASCAGTRPPVPSVNADAVPKALTKNWRVAGTKNLSNMPASEARYDVKRASDA